MASRTLPNSLTQLDYNSRMQKPSGKDPMVSLARYSEIGFIIPAAVLLGFFLGKLMDYWLHTKWLYLVGLLFGAVVGFTQMIRMAFGASKDSSSKSDSNSDDAQ
jgi:F0F1-type ATP synthase assembly protein I